LEYYLVDSLRGLVDYLDGVGVSAARTNAWSCGEDGRDEPAQEWGNRRQPRNHQ
jgi:hypothetical protein